jgi:hypothetical protein
MKVEVDREALFNVIAYLWRDEQQDAMASLEEYGPGLRHIYDSLKILADDSNAPVEDWEIKF